MAKLEVNYRDPSEWTKADREEAAAKITLAKTHLTLREPFFAVLALRLRTRPHHCHPFKTMMVSHDTIYYNVDYALALSHEECLFLLCHETCHPAFGHIFRRNGRKPLKWNIAIDAATNVLLTDYGIGKAPDDGGVPPKDEYRGKTAEQIYDEMPDDTAEAKHLVLPDGDGDGSSQGEEGDDPSEDQQDAQPGDASGVHDGHIYGERTPEQDEREGRKWQKAVIEAVQRAEEMKKQGSVPAEFRRMVDDLVHPKVPWQRELLPFVQMAASDDYSWRRLNRRYLAHGFLFPTMKSPSLPEVAVHIDTSGSMSQEEITGCVSETLGILHTFIPERLHFLACDAGFHGAESGDVMPNSIIVKDRHEMMNPQQVIQELIDGLAGGGGTSFVPTFNYVAANRGIRLVIVMTDGYGAFPETEKWRGFPTFWVSTENGLDLDAYPFGRAVRM
jgi:predicted metal-dependent peptidase